MRHDAIEMIVIIIIIHFVVLVVVRTIFRGASSENNGNKRRSQRLVGTGWEGGWGGGRSGKHQGVVNYCRPGSPLLKRRFLYILPLSRCCSRIKARLPVGGQLLRWD